MKPADAEITDRYMYYNGCWLMTPKGPRQITINAKGSFEDAGDGTVYNPTKLEHWFPRSGAYQVSMNQACYIVRKAARNMRKSAHEDSHYEVQWGNTGYRSKLQVIAEPRKCHTCDIPLKPGGPKSIAVTRDIILSLGPHGTTEIIYRGERVGTLTDEGFDPDSLNNPMCKRTFFQLNEEGII